MTTSATEFDPVTATVTELKAAAYDLIVHAQIIADGLAAVERELERRLIPSDEPPPAPLATP